MTRWQHGNVPLTMLHCATQGIGAAAVALYGIQVLMALVRPNPVCAYTLSFLAESVSHTCGVQAHSFHFRL